MENDTLTCSIGVLNYASFKGVSFWVKSDEGTFGRRNAHHEFPKGDVPANEDMGKKQRKFSVTGYVVGDDSRAQKDALVAVIESYGGGILVLPAEDPQNCVCDSLSVTRNKDDQGIFDLKMEFYEDPFYFGGSISIVSSAFEGLIGGVFSAAIDPIGAAFLSTFNVDNTQAYVYANAIARAQTFAQVLTTGIENFGVADERPIVNATTALIGLYQNTADIVRPGARYGGNYTLNAALADIFYNVLNVKNPAVIVDAMSGLADFSVLEATSNIDASAGYPGDAPVLVYVGDKLTMTYVQGTVLAPSEKADTDNAAAFNGMVRSYALIGLAKGLAATVFADKQTAIQARANLVELMQRQMERTNSYDVAVALANARDYCVKSLNVQIAGIVPMIHVSSTATLPSLYWGGRLYNNAARALELSERNRVRTAAYMPQEFDALSV